VAENLDRIAQGLEPLYLIAKKSEANTATR
jgi:hypothetical protein